MFLFATILYFGESPVGYDVHREEGLFRFEPAIASQSSNAPVITVVYLRGSWMVEGVEDTDVLEQVNRTIELNDLLTRHPLSAAS